tara:strand:+ start:786 stop:1394 length:609 start_codon:yes stop_codon:yes gene_type:complete
MTYFDSKNVFVDQPIEKGLSCASELLNKRSLEMDVFDSYLNGKKVIDLGCNNGRWSSYFLDKGATFVEGVDIDPTYIESAKVCMATYFSSDKYSFTVANIVDYTPSNSYDVATIFNTLHYNAPFDQIRKVASYANTILVEMGLGVENVLDPNSFHQGGLQTFITPQLAKELLTELGFTITELASLDDEIIGQRARFVAIKSS